MHVIAPLSNARWLDNIKANFARQEGFDWKQLWIVGNNGCEELGTYWAYGNSENGGRLCSGPSKLEAIDRAMEVILRQSEIGGRRLVDDAIAVLDQDDYYPADSLAKKHKLLQSFDVVAQARGEVRLRDGRVLQFEQPEDGESLRPGEAYGASMAWRSSAYVTAVGGPAMGDGQRLLAAMLEKGARGAFGRFGDVYVRHEHGHVWEISRDEFETMRCNTRGKLLTVDGVPYVEPA